MSSVTHLVGHQIGLPGLHQDGRYVTQDSFGYWGLMACDNSQGLSGFTRFHSKWYDTRFGELVIDIEPGGWEEPLFYLVEPSFQFIGSFLPPGVFEIVRIRRPSLPDVLLEARPKFSVDASRFAEGFSRLGDFSGLPNDYQPGVLVSLIDPGYHGVIFLQPGQYGVPVAQVLPHFEEGVPAADKEETASKLNNATITEQQVFQDAYGLEVMVGRFDRFEGSYEVAIKSGPLPSFPDLVILGSWLDSSVNGYGTFTFGRDEVSGEPRMGGDPVHLSKRPEFRWVNASLEVGVRSGSREHRVTFQLENAGLSDAHNLAGTIYVLPGRILPLGDSLFDTEVLSSLALAHEDVFIEELIPGEKSEVSMVFCPDGPVQAVLLLEPSPHENVIHNNRHRSVFWTEYADLDTFYPSINQTVHIYNGSAFDHHLAAQVSNVPVGWQERFSMADAESLRWSTLLNSKGSGNFQLHLTPPSSDEEMPGTIQQIAIDTWVDYSISGDSFVLETRFVVARKRSQ